MRSLFFIFLLICQLGISQNGKFKVVLDAGHGGKDPGKVQGKIYEKNIVLNIALLVGKTLENEPDYSVIYTRKDDRFIELYERGHIANKAKADLFISIHCNSAPVPQAKGVETYVLGLHANDINFEVAKEENQVIYLEENYQEKYAGYDINSPESFIGLSIMQEEFLEQSIQIAKKIQNNFTQSLGRKDRGVRQAGFIVLHQTYMPSVLIEAGFLTNSEDLAYLTSEVGQQEVAQSIVKAIKSYRSWIKNKTAEAAFLPEAVDPKKKQEPQMLPSSKKTDPIPPKKNENTPPKTQKKEGTSPKKTTIPAQTTKEEPLKKTEVKSPPPPPKKTEAPPKTPTAPAAQPALYFRVQLATSVHNMELKKENFKGLTALYKEPIGQFHRYYYGRATDLPTAKRLQETAKKAGYKDAFIVPFSDGKRTTLEALGLQ